MPLPTLQEIQNASDGEILISEGVENGARLIELGNFAESKKNDPKTVSLLEDWMKKVLKGNQIVSPARNDIDLDPQTRLIAIETHMTERIFLAWLNKMGYKGVKDDVISMLDEMIQYGRLTGKPSPLEESFRKLHWIKEEKYEKLRQQFELETNELPGTISGTMPADVQKNIIFNEYRCINLYEDPNPLLFHLLGRKVGNIAKKLANQIGTDPNKAFSVILDTGNGITTLAFDEWRKTGNKMRRSCEIRTRSGNTVGQISHMTLIGKKLPDDEIEYLIEGRELFEMGYGHMHFVGIGNEWTRTYTDESNEKEFINRPQTPLMLNAILSQTHGRMVDNFALQYPDQSPRAVAAQFLGHPDGIIIDLENDIVLVPSVRRNDMNLHSDEVIMKKYLLSELLSKAKGKCDPSQRFEVCDEVFEAKYGKTAQSITTSGNDEK